MQTTIQFSSEMTPAELNGQIIQLSHEITLDQYQIEGKLERIERYRSELNSRANQVSIIIGKEIVPMQYLQLAELLSLSK